jgi:hypothetical protein
VFSAKRKEHRELRKEEAKRALKITINDLVTYRGLPAELIPSLLHELAEEMNANGNVVVKLHEPVLADFTPHKQRSRKPNVDHVFRTAEPLAVVQMLRVAGLCATQGKSEKSMTQILDVINRKGEHFCPL